MSNRFENNYPAGFSFFPEMYNHIDPVDQLYFSGLHQEIDTVERTLGLNPQGAYSTVDERIDNMLSGWLFFLSEYLYAPGGNVYKDIKIRDGKSLYCYDASNVKYTEMLHDGAVGKIYSSSGFLELSSATGILSNIDMYIKTGKSLYLYDAGGTRYVRSYHDGSNGWVSTSSGALKLESPESIKMYVPLIKYNGKVTYNYDAGNTKYICNYHDGTDGYISTNSGKLILNAATDVWLQCVLRQCGSGGIYSYDDSAASYISINHNNVDGTISTNKGKLIFNPVTSVDFGYNPIIGVDELTHKAQSDGAKVHLWQAAGATGEWINLHFQDNATSTFRFRGLGELYIRHLYDTYNIWLDDQYPGTPTKPMMRIDVSTSPGCGIYSENTNTGGDILHLKGLTGGGAQTPVIKIEEGYLKAQTGGNRMFGTATIADGTNSVTVTPTIAAATSLIFVTCQSGDASLAYSIANKGVQTFDIVASGNVTGDTVIAYWIINTY